MYLEEWAYIPYMGGGVVLPMANPMFGQPQAPYGCPGVMFRRAREGGGENGLEEVGGLSGGQVGSPELFIGLEYRREEPRLQDIDEDNIFRPPRPPIFDIDEDNIFRPPRPPIFDTDEDNIFRPPRPPIFDTDEDSTPIPMNIYTENKIENEEESKKEYIPVLRYEPWNKPFPRRIRVIGGRMYPYDNCSFTHTSGVIGENLFGQDLRVSKRHRKISIQERDLPSISAPEFVSQLKSLNPCNPHAIGCAQLMELLEYKHIAEPPLKGNMLSSLVHMNEYRSIKKLRKELFNLAEDYPLPVFLAAFNWSEEEGILPNSFFFSQKLSLLLGYSLHAFSSLVHIHNGFEIFHPDEHFRIYEQVLLKISSLRETIFNNPHDYSSIRLRLVHRSMRIIYATFHLAIFKLPLGGYITGIFSDIIYSQQIMLTDHDNYPNELQPDLFPPNQVLYSIHSGKLVRRILKSLFDYLSQIAHNENILVQNILLGQQP